MSVIRFKIPFFKGNVNSSFHKPGSIVVTQSRGQQQSSGYTVCTELAWRMSSGTTYCEICSTYWAPLGSTGSLWESFFPPVIKEKKLRHLLEQY